MTIPFITWCAIVGIVVVTAVWSTARGRRAARLSHTRVFELGSESEELFVPGDPTPSNVADYGDDD